MFSHIKELFTRPSGYRISRSVRLRSSASAYFNRTPGSTTNQKTWTFSAWMKWSVNDNNAFNQGVFSATDGNLSGILFSQSSNTPYQLSVYNCGFQITTSQVFRDPSAWYHIVAVIDTTQATAANRTKLYVNGVQVTAFSTATYPAQNANSAMNTATISNIIGNQTGQTRYFDGYLTEINFIDGQALTPSSFGQTNTVTGVWQPIKYTGTYGTNGFYLNFSDNSNNTATTIGKDYSGNGNNWTPNNISVTAGATYDSMLDVPTLTSATAANYCTYNSAGSAPSVTLSAANLDASHGAFSSTCGAAGTFGVSSGKWYWEVTINAISSGAPYIGIVRSDQLYPFTTLFANNSQGYAYRATGQKRNNGVDASYGATYAAGDVIGVALDMDAGTLVFYKNNASQGTAYSSLSGVFMPIDANGTSGGTYTSTINFGQRPFSYTPPTGFVALNTQNLPTPTISNGATVMAASTYTGTGATQTIANSGNNAASISFKPDWVWIKSRSAATNNNLFDSVRGTTDYLISNSTAAAATNANTLTAFGTTGFTLGSDASALGVNVNAATYVAWQWQAGQGSTSSNTSGSITSTVSVNATAGFSIATFTTPASGTSSFGHGLGVTPAFVIVKGRAGGNWICEHQSTGSKYLLLNGTGAATTDSTVFNATPTSSVVNLGTGFAGTLNYVAYCFAPVAGYSAFGSYTGNGSTDGPFVYLGFRPRYVMWKRTDAVNDWYIIDTSRSPYNEAINPLAANLSSAESSLGTNIDFISNGFKPRQTGAHINASGGTYIYAAFAESPFKLALAR